MTHVPTATGIAACRTINAFVGPRAQGNPAGVLLLEKAIEESAMRQIARTMQHSETAFLRETAPGVYHLRWFTPEAEVKLCGHATLASAWSLWNQHGVESDVLAFDTLSGRLLARRIGHQVELDFPQDVGTKWVPSRAVLSSLGIHRFVAAQVSPTTHKMLIEVGSAADVSALRPNIAALREAVPGSPGGVIVTARGDAPFDFVSRYFHPWVGVDEDPVTGSAHCLLATYWSNVVGKTEMRAFQASARGGILDVQLAGGRIKLRGEARARDETDKNVVGARHQNAIA